MTYPNVVGFALKYYSELSTQVTAESGNWKDGHHLGKLIYKALRNTPKDFVLQIDGDGGDTRTAESVLEKTIQCASAMRNIGLKMGDVVMVLAPNHLDVVLPLYACLFNGFKFFGVDRFSRVSELAHFMQTSKPTMILCQNEKVVEIKEALRIVNMSPTIITFNESWECLTFSEFMAKSDENIKSDNYTIANLDPEETIALLLATSGTTGLSKCAAVTHTNMAVFIPYVVGCRTEFPTPTKLTIITSPSQWLSAIMLMIMNPIIQVPSLTTTKPTTEQWVAEMINTYKVTFGIISPPFANSLSKYCLAKNITLPSIDHMFLGGSAITTKCLEDFRKVATKCQIATGFGLSEVGVIGYAYDMVLSPGLVLCPPVKYKLVDVDSGKEITEPNITGELWVRGPTVFKGYYNNPDATKSAFTEDGWFKTGDLMQLDEHHHLVYVERLKMMLKYKSHQISPLEVEEVISHHPAVLETAVTGVPSEEEGDLVVAFVVVKNNAEVTAQEIKDCVKDNLSDSKQLRGGVIFIESVPKTATDKIDRKQLKKLAAELPRE